MNFTDLEIKHMKEIRRSFGSLKTFYDEAIKIKDIDFKENEISKAILVRMCSWYGLQDNIKSFLNKRYITAGSDFFVETILLYLKIIFKIKNVGLEIHSERKIKKKKGAIRPDISIWKGEEVKAIIECKTQLGWNRYGWKKTFEGRERKLKSEFPNAKAFLVVMTSKNWPGFGEDENVGKKFFALYDIWPTDVDLNKNPDNYIKNPIEPLIESLISIAEEITEKT